MTSRRAQGKRADDSLVMLGQFLDGLKALGVQIGDPPGPHFSTASRRGTFGSPQRGRQGIKSVRVGEFGNYRVPCEPPPGAPPPWAVTQR